MRFIDGWKTWLSAVAWIGVVAYGLVTGHDVRPIAGAIAEAIGWSSPTAADWMFYLIAANSALALWGICGKALKGYRQWRAGASLGELETPQGVIRLAAKDGTLRSMKTTPVVLTISDAAAPESLVAVVAQPAR